MRKDNQSFTAALQTIFNSFLSANINTCIPGIVNNYDYKIQKASITPAINKAFLNGDSLKYKPIENVPIVFPTAGNYGLTFPINKGDSVMLIFSQRSLEIWLNKGGITDPGDPRKFDITDAIAIPGLNPFNFNGFQQENNEDVKLTGDNTLTIKKDGSIDIGEQDLKKLVNEEFLNMFNNHVHNFIGAPSGSFSTSTPASQTGLLPPPVPNPATPAPGVQMGSTELTSKVSAE